jgi:hypothetical protein
MNTIISMLDGNADFDCKSCSVYTVCVVLTLAVNSLPNPISIKTVSRGKLERTTNPVKTNNSNCWLHNNSKEANNFAEKASKITTHTQKNLSVSNLLLLKN